MIVRRTRRASAALLVLLTFLLVPALEVCTGWAGTASDRHVCCATAEHGSGAAVTDACCAAGEQRQHAETAGRAFVIAPPSMVALGLPAVPMVRGVRPLCAQAEPNWRTPADTRLLLSVFLI